jgi:hypothetical protein
LPWKLIFILALIQLTRPILSTAGFFDNFTADCDDGAPGIVDA